MNKPSWDDAPEWAQFVAQDSNGSWYWYEYRPGTDEVQWYEASNEGRIEAAQPVGLPWRETLETRP